MMQQTIISGRSEKASILIKKTPLRVQCVFQLFVIISEFLSLPNCGNWYQSFCSWEFLAAISLSASTGECFEFASLQLPRFLAFLPLISFCYREDQDYPSLKLSTRTMGILVCLGNNFFCGNSTECTGVKRILRKPLTLKPNLHNKTGNRET